MSAPTPDVSSVLDRSGHLPEIAFDRLRLDPRASAPAFFEACEAHLAACAGCRSAFAALRSEDEAEASAPPAMGQVVPLRAGTASKARWARILTTSGVAVALAASVLIALRPGSVRAPDATGESDLRAKGGVIDLEVHVHDGQASRSVGDLAIVHPGERVGFGLHARQAGFLLLFGWDRSGVAYQVHPAEPAPAMPFGPTDAVVALPMSLRLDAVLGDEHLAALFCAEPFALSDVASGERVDVALLGARPGCALRVVVLDKRPVE